MYFAILQRWEGEKAESLCLEYPLNKKEECIRMLGSLRKDAYKKKHPVEYRLVELDGEMEYAGKKIDDWRKKNNVDRIIIANGKVYDDVPLYIEKDLRKG